MTTPTAQAKLVIMGGGNMARAIVRGGLDAGVLRPGEVVVCEPDKTAHGAFAALRVAVTASHKEAMAGLGRDTQVLLAIKPQMLATLADQLRPQWRRVAEGVVVITVLAGTPSEKVRGLLGVPGTELRVVRAMPNLAASLRRSATALCLGAGARAGDEEFAAVLFTGIGRLVVRIDESLMDAFTAVAGSGPAYVFYLAEAMMRAATELGLDAATADKVVRETIAGAAGLLEQTSEDPAKLRAAVTSKGGTTAAAAKVLEEAGVMESFVAALRAARDRGRELSGM